MQQNTTDFIAKIAWKTTRSNWKELMTLPLTVVAATLFVVNLLVQTQTTGALVAVVILYLALVVFFIAFSTAIAKWCSDLHAGAKKIDVEAGLRYGLSRFWGVLGTTLLTGIKTFLWALLLLIPGYYKSIMYSKSIKVSQLEKISGGDANRISQKMVSDAGFLRTLGNILVIGLVSVGLFYIYAFLLFGLSSLLEMASQTLALIVMIVLFSVGAVVFSTFMMVYYSYEYLVYRDENKAELTALMKTLASMK